MYKEETVQSRFSRSVDNAAKMGAYYTDRAHCSDMSLFLQFPEEPVCCLEPSIGDGAAIKCVTGKQKEDNKFLFGVELNPKTAQETRKDPLMEEILSADFLHGTVITQKAFSFCFSNPPYLVMEDGIRAERLFLEKITNLLKKDGVLVYVIPYSVFSERGFLRYFYNRYAFLKVFKFREQEFAKWHQVVIFARKRASNKNILAPETDALQKKYGNVDLLEELPKDYEGKKIRVLPSNPEEIVNFTIAEFPEEMFLQYLHSDRAKEQLQETDRMVNNILTVKPYEKASTSRPPIHPNKDSMYLLGVCGAGNGTCGSVADGNLHLQRGIVHMVEDQELEQTEDGEKYVLKVTTRASVTYKVIENDGRISDLA